MSEDAQAVRKAECARCSGSRNCDIVGQHLENGQDGLVQFWTHWYVLKCRGCDYVFVQTAASHSEATLWYYEDESGEQHQTYAEQLSYWPALSTRAMPNWHVELDDDLINIDDLRVALRELYEALNGDLRVLAAVGARIVFDTASSLLGVEERLSFEQKLESLVTKGFIGKLDVSRMEMLVEAGNASVHRGWRPTADELSTVMDVLEHFLQTALIEPARKKRLDEQATKVRGRVPGKTPRPKHGAQKQAAPPGSGLLE